MITVSFKKRNLCEQSAIAEGLQYAVKHFSNMCDIERIGYEIRCESCHYKQGCRDLYRAARYANYNWEMSVYKYETNEI